MGKIILVAGSDHRKIANALQQLLLSSDIQIQIVTMKSQRDILLKLAEESSQAIWLVSPQTVDDRPYTNIQQLLKRKGISVLPVIVVPVENIPFSESPIQLKQNYRITASEIVESLRNIKPASARITPSKLALGLMLVSIIFILGIASLILLNRGQQDTSMPTFVALNPESLALSNTISKTLNSISATDNAAGYISITRTPDNRPEATDEADNLLSSPEPESTEDVDLVEVTDEPTESFSLETGGILLADFSADPQRGDAPLKVNITNLSTGSMSAYRWDYETDGIIDNTDFEPPTIIYEKPGIYTLTLMLRDSNGTIVESQSVIEVFDANPNGSNVSSGSTFASFETSPSSGQFPLPVRFINRSVGSNLTFEWDFDGDSRVDFIGPSPSVHEYTKAGTYTARLTAISPNGTRERAQAQINVYSSSPDNPNEIIYDVDSRANFEVLPPSGTVPFRVTINNLSVGGNNSYEWDFNGDGLPDSASSQPPQQRYATAGTYKISLTVYGFDRYGNAKTSRAQIQVVAKGIQPKDEPDVTYEDFDLEADFVANVFQGTAPLTVEFYNYSTGDILNYQWDFNGDGIIDSTESDPIHTFVKGGIYEVLLRVSDANSSNETSLTIEVIGAESTKTAIPKTATPQASSTLSASATVNPNSQTLTQTVTATKTVLATVTSNGTVIATTTQTATVIASQTSLASASATIASSPTASSTSTPIPINTATATLTATNTPSATFTLTYTPTFTATYTATVTSSPVPTQTPQPSNTPEPEP